MAASARARQRALEDDAWSSQRDGAPPPPQSSDFAVWHLRWRQQHALQAAGEMLRRLTLADRLLAASHDAPPRLPTAPPVRPQRDPDSDTDVGARGPEAALQRLSNAALAAVRDLELQRETERLARSLCESALLEAS